MNALDWTIIGLYMLGLIALSAWLGRNQADAEDYYVGGRKLPWWAVGISTMATQSSVISFISVPAFVALKEGGGLTWLQYELALPLALIFVMVLLIPFFRNLNLISVYEYLELRFGRPVRLLMSGIFLVSRGLATGVSVYATAILLRVCLGVPLWAIILIVGVITVVYDTIGGMTAVVYTDVIQLFVLVAGLLLCVVYAVGMAGGLDSVLASLPPDRWRAFDSSAGLGMDSSDTPFWAILIGGFFLYASYYGVDQSQAQRELSAPTLADTKRSLVLNAVARFPLTLLYIVLGVAVGAAYLHSPQLQAAVQKPDDLVPQFIILALPQGVRAILIAAALAAAMSSLDSALNSLSASTVRDFIQRDRELPKEKVLRLGKIVTVLWGVAITGFAFLVGGISDTVVEGINKIGSAFYGPILGAFVIGVVSKRATMRAVIVGVVVGVLFNLSLWIFRPEVFWMWWNLFGLVITVGVTLFASKLEPPPAQAIVDKYTLAWSGILKAERRWLRTYAVLMGYFVLILATVLFAHVIAR